MNFKSVFQNLAFFFLASPLFGAPHVFDVRVADLQFGELVVDHEYSENEYKVSIDFGTVSMANILFDYTLTGEAQGTGEEYGTYLPKSASVTFKDRYEEYSRNIDYEEDIISNLEISPALKSDIPPETQKGSVDPVTAFAYIFRERPLGRLCSLRIPVFDGSRSAHIILQPPKKRFDGRMECIAAIEVMHGFEADDLLAKEPVFFNIIFRNNERNLFEVDRIVGRTAIGDFHLARDFLAEHIGGN